VDQFSKSLDKHVPDALKQIRIYLNDKDTEDALYKTIKVAFPFFRLVYFTNLENKKKSKSTSKRKEEKKGEERKRKDEEEKEEEKEEF